MIGDCHFILWCQEITIYTCSIASEQHQAKIIPDCYSPTQAISAPACFEANITPGMTTAEAMLVFAVGLWRPAAPAGGNVRVTSVMSNAALACCVWYSPHGVIAVCEDN